MSFLKKVQQASLAKIQADTPDFNSMTRAKAERFLHDMFSKHTKGVFSDEHWKPWHDILDDLNKYNITYKVGDAKYYKLRDSDPESLADGKRWELTIYAGDKGGWHVFVTASFGPSPINKPGSKYDMIYTVNWDGRLRKEQIESSVSFKQQVEAKYAIVEKIKSFAKKATKAALGLILSMSIFTGAAMAKNIEKDAADLGKKMTKIMENSDIDVDVECKGKSLGGKKFQMSCKWTDGDGKSAVVNWLHLDQGDDDVKMKGSPDSEAGAFAYDFFETLKDKAQSDFFKGK